MALHNADPLAVCVYSAYFFNHSGVARPRPTRACALPSMQPSRPHHHNRVIPQWIKPKLIAVLTIIDL